MPHSGQASIGGPRREAPWARRRQGRSAARLAATLLLLGAPGGCRRIGLTPGEPNVLLVTITRCAADHVGAYGATLAETPTLDRLAAEGTRFARVVVSPSCRCGSWKTGFATATWRGAAEHARIALQGDPGDARARIKVGKLWSHVGAHDGAPDAFREAVRIDPVPGYGHMLLAIESAHLGLATEAETHRARAAEAAHDPWPLGRLGAGYPRGVISPGPRRCSTGSAGSTPTTRHGASSRECSVQRVRDEADAALARSGRARSAAGSPARI